MIRVTCPGCGSKLNAKDQLIGETRPCPKCKTEVLISVSQTANLPAGGAQAEADDSVLGEVTADAHADRTSQSTLQQLDLPERLDRENHYLICDKAHVVASWENNGQGWMLTTPFGAISATRNYEQLPAQGNFKLVELKLEVTDDGLRLRGMRVYQLAQRWALTTLDKGPDQICSKITALGHLAKEQKSAVRNIIKDQFMRHVWEDAENVLEYLANTDYHSPGTE
jgi:hypothetical protein